MNNYLHNVQEIVVNLRLTAELELDLIKVGESILHLQPLEGGRLRGRGAGGDPRQVVGGHRAHARLLRAAPELHRAVRHLLHDVALAGVQLHGGGRVARGHGHRDRGRRRADGLGQGGEGGVGLHRHRRLRQRDRLGREAEAGGGRRLRGHLGRAGGGRQLVVDHGAGLGRVGRGGGGGDGRAFPADNVVRLTLTSVPE